MTINDILNEKIRLKTAIAWIDLYVQSKTAAADTVDPERHAKFEELAAKYLSEYEKIMNSKKSDSTTNKFPYLWTKN